MFAYFCGSVFDQVSKQLWTNFCDIFQRPGPSAARNSYILIRKILCRKCGNYGACISVQKISDWDNAENIGNVCSM